MKGKIDPRWRKASYSGNGGGNCVEVGQAGGVLVRDTEDRTGPVLAVSPAAWQAFTRRIRAGRLANARTMPRRPMTGGASSCAALTSVGGSAGTW